MSVVEDNKVFLDYISEIEHKLVTAGGSMAHGDGHAKAIHDWEARREELVAKHGSSTAENLIMLPKMACDACAAGKPGLSALFLVVAHIAEETADNPSRLLSALIDLRDIGKPGGIARITPHHTPPPKAKTRRRAKVT